MDGTVQQHDSTGDEKRLVIDPDDHSYRKVLTLRQLRMIAVGGTVGTGLFLGTGASLHNAGPGVFLVYAVCGLFVYLILRALGELVLHRASSGSFVSYAREFFGEKMAFAAGWMYFLNWAMAGIVDITGIARYFHYWPAFGRAPEWLIALVVLAVVMAVNVTSVRWFGEVEFWVALVKVVAITAFLVSGVLVLGSRTTIRGQLIGLDIMAHSGGFFPSGPLQLIMVSTSAIFSYAAVELVGTAAGEAEHPAKAVPRAINSAAGLLVLFYVGSLVLLGLLGATSDYHPGVSPFVSFFARLNVHGAGSVMNVVVITAAFSSLNAGLYSTGRILRSLGMNGSAPRLTTKMSRHGVPYVGIALAGIIGLCGVALELFEPSRAFEIVLNVASLGVIAAWATIVLCQLQLWRWSRRRRLRRPAFRLPGSPFTGIATLIFLGAIVVGMGFNSDDGHLQQWTLASLGIVIPALVFGWFLARRRVRIIARWRGSDTDAFPVLAGPAIDPVEE